MYYNLRFGFVFFVHDIYKKLLELWTELCL